MKSFLAFLQVRGKARRDAVMPRRFIHGFHRLGSVSRLTALATELLANQKSDDGAQPTPVTSLARAAPQGLSKPSRMFPEPDFALTYAARGAIR